MNLRFHLRKHVLVGLLILILGACGGNGGDTEPAAGTDDTAESPTPSAEPEPELADAQLEGKWRHVRVNTRVTNRTSTSLVEHLQKGFKAEFLYTMRPTCPAGPCDVNVKYKYLGPGGESDTFTIEYRNGQYARRSVDRGGSCAGVDPAWKATTTTTFEPTEAEDRDGAWVATAYEGTYRQVHQPVNSTVRNAGCGPATIIGTISGKRMD